MKSKWRTLSRGLVYRNPWLQVFEDRVRRPDGSNGTYGVVEVGDAVSVVAMAGDRVCLVRQYRHSWGKRVWEVPCGGLHRGEKLLAAAKRELREEAGITARLWRRLGVVEANDPVVNRFHLFLATELQHGNHRRDLSEADMESRMWRLKDFRRAVLSGRIRDDMTIACVAKALMAGGWKP
jgi:8-oxo-dGTP pyrophosphatase MutT (NUDIX family)